MNRLIDIELVPALRGFEMDQITAPQLLQVLRKIEDRGARETAHRTRRLASSVFKHVIATGRATRDIAADLEGVLKTPKKAENFSQITDPQEFGFLLRCIDSYQGDPGTKAGLQLLPILFNRPGELRLSKWNEFDLDEATWTVHKERMKAGRVHIVPLPHQAIAILRELHSVTGYLQTNYEGFVLPSLRSRGKPVSEVSFVNGLRRMGFDGKTQADQGFRGTASTLLHEKGWPHDWIETQLAHKTGSRIAQAYNHSSHFQERIIMLQW